MKILKSVLGFIFAALVVIGLVLPFKLVPQKFAADDRAATLERLSKDGFEVDSSYVDARVSEAAKNNFSVTFKTAAIVAAMIVLGIYFISFRAPHDRGGINLFNPIYIPFIFALGLGLRFTITLALDASSSQSVLEFRRVVQFFTDNIVGGDRWITLLLIPVLIELVFRCLLISYIEKARLVPTVLISTAAYVGVMYLAFRFYGTWLFGSASGAATALWISALIGVVLGLVTWTLRSGIPAVLIHIIIVHSGVWAASFKALPISIVILAVSAAAIIVVPNLLGSKIKPLSADFPFERHHKRMHKWIGDYVGKKRKRKPRTNADEQVGASA